MTALSVRSKDEIPDDAYRKMVLTLMDKQASREVATAEVFGQCVLYAPTVEDKIRITRFQHEELKHFQLLAKLMGDLGVDMDVYVRDRQRAGARFTGDEADIQIRDWLDATLFNFMIDRAATFQLTEYTKGSYLPLAKANDVILKEEEGHKNFGEACLEEMCQDPATRAEIQRRFKKWFVASMRIFGRAGTPGNQYCLRVGLKDTGQRRHRRRVPRQHPARHGALRAPLPRSARAPARAAAADRPERPCRSSGLAQRTETELLFPGHSKDDRLDRVVIDAVCTAETESGRRNLPSLIQNPFEPVLTGTGESHGTHQADHDRRAAQVRRTGISQSIRQRWRHIVGRLDP